MRKDVLMISVMLLVLLSTTVFALTGSIGNGRMVLRPEVDPPAPTIIDKYITVNNVNDIPVRIQVQADANYKKIIEILDDDFILEPGQSKRAYFRITLLSGGNYAGRVLVSFYSTDEEADDAPVGLSSFISIIAEGQVTDHYYEVMESLGDENDDIYDDDLLAYEQENMNDYIDYEDLDNMAEDDSDVSFSFGRNFETPDEKSNAASGDSLSDDSARGDRDSRAPNIFVGIFVMLLIVAVGGTFIYLVVRR